MELKKYKLGEIAYFVEDKISSDDVSLSEYITTDCLLQNKKGRTIAQNLPPKPCSLTKFKKGDVLIGNIRPYLKKIWFADIDGGCSLDVLTLRSKNENESSYLYSLLLQDDFYDFVMKATKGSKMPRGDKKHILTFLCFDINNKIKIGDLFSKIDRKITLNRRINTKLETIAKRLYDYWFVQFDFPDANGNPYKSSGGKMVWNDALKREIPEGWEVKRLGEVCSFRNGINYDKNTKGDTIYKIVNVRNITASSLLMNQNDFDKICLQSKLADNYLIPENSILIARSGTPGATRMIFNVENNVIFCGFIICMENFDPTLKSYLAFCLKKLENTSATKTGGSILQNVSQDTLKRLCVILPPKDIIAAFNAKTLSIFNYQLSIEKETARLTALRDKLLPLLMNGQVEVA